jgi:hypothetical protein
MSLDWHLQQKRKELKKLQEQYALSSDKIEGLEKQYIIEANAQIRFQLKEQIKDAKAERARLFKYLEALEVERIHSALFRLNYIKQVQLFREFIEEN